MIKVENLTKKFGDFIAVDNVSFSVNKGEIFAFLGPNGAGKTTTIRMLTTLLKPTSGRIFINGSDPVREQNDVRREKEPQKFSEPLLLARPSGGLAFKKIQKRLLILF